MWPGGGIGETLHGPVAPMHVGEMYQQKYGTDRQGTQDPWALEPERIEFAQHEQPGQQHECPDEHFHRNDDERCGTKAIWTFRAHIIDRRRLRSSRNPSSRSEPPAIMIGKNSSLRMLCSVTFTRVFSMRSISS